MELKLERTGSLMQRPTGGSVLENYLALRAFAVPESSRSFRTAVVVLGRNFTGDGGAGIFPWVPRSSPLFDTVGGDADGTMVESTTGQGMWLRVFAGPVDVRWFGACGDDPANTTSGADSTGAFEAGNRAANNAGLHPRVPAGGTYWLDSWVPLAGTTVECWGATIRLTTPESEAHKSANQAGRDDDDGARAAIALRHGGVTILGGVFEVPNKIPWTGCILVEGGRDITIRDAELRYAWSGLFGQASQPFAAQSFWTASQRMPNS